MMWQILVCVLVNMFVAPHVPVDLHVQMLNPLFIVHGDINFQLTALRNNNKREITFDRPIKMWVKCKVGF